MMRFVTSILVFTASAVVLQAAAARGACPGADGCLIAGHQEEKLHLTLSGKNIELLAAYDLVETSSGC